MSKKRVMVFLTAEAALYLAFLTLDFFQLSGPHIWLKYTGVVLCCVFSCWAAGQGGERLIPVALVLTALADLFLLVLNQFYTFGVLLFLGVQVVYLLRLRKMTGFCWWPLRLGLPVLFWSVLSAWEQITLLTLLAALYFSQLLVNTILAWRHKQDLYFPLGLTLFVCCDLCVGIFNSAPLFPRALFRFAEVGMWFFYLPSQVLIALSTQSRQENCHERF